MRPDCAERQRTPCDCARPCECGLVERVVARARACQAQSVKGDVFVRARVLVGVSACGGLEFDSCPFRADKSCEGIVSALRECLRDVRIPVVDLVKARAICEREIQLLRRNPARPLGRCRSERVVPRARAGESQPRIAYFVCPGDILPAAVAATLPSSPATILPSAAWNCDASAVVLPS